MYVVALHRCTMDMMYDRTHKDLSGGRETVSVQVDSSVNLCDSGLLDFVYMKDNFCDDDEINTEQYQGCTCTDCFTDQHCSCTSAFGAQYDKRRCLMNFRPDLRTMSPVLECNSQCACDASCFNRVVQLGLSIALQVFNAGAKGSGVRTMEPVQCNQFVCEYAGELLSQESATRRLKCLSTHNYILSLHEYYGEKMQRQTTYIDPTYIGNAARFINHSCDPNLFMVPVRVNNRVPRAALFALQDINAGCELTYSYSGLPHPGETDFTCETADDVVVRKHCFCGSLKCTSFLPCDLSAG